MLVTLTVIYYMVYPEIVKEAFSMFNCTSNIDGIRYLVKNTNIECFGYSHKRLLLTVVIPTVGFWIFGVPMTILYMIFRKRKNLDKLENLRAYGFWYLGLKRNRFYWELL